MIAVMRLILAISALTVTYLYPTEPDRFATIVYTLLGLYTLHSAIICLVLWQPGRLAKFLYRWAHWFDVVWYTLFVALSSGTSSFFFFGYFFAILVASFRWGLKEGLIVTTVSVISFVIVSLIARPYGVELELNRFLLRSISFLLLGYMIAYWGDSEIKLRRRLELLREIARISNPRFGVDRTVGSVLERLRAFYDANAYLLVRADHTTATFTVRRADRQHPEAAISDEPLAAELAKKNVGVPNRLCRHLSLPAQPVGASVSQLLFETLVFQLQLFC